MNIKVWAVAIVAFGLGLLSSCEKSKDEPTTSTAKTFTIDATAFDKFVYFNFESGKQVELTDSASTSSTAWDIAFHRYDFRTNSGTATTVGKGGAAVTTATDINAGIAIPDAASFKVDVNKNVVIQYGGPAAAQGGHPGIKYAERAVNPVLTTAVKEGVQMPTSENDFESKGAIWSLGMPPAYYVSDKVFIIRTATGKYARIKITSYKGTITKDGQNSSKNAYVEFQYIYPVS